MVDKPAGITSHDVVARTRRLAGTRRVGHAGTLDPAATGVLVLGIEKGTKLLGHLALGDKDYTATIRLGRSTSTDDAEGELLGGASAAGVTDSAVAAGLAALTGTIQQRPSSVSAIKVDGQRAYARVRAGEQVELAARTVTVSALRAVDSRREGDFLDVDVEVTCSSGTYVRALARDLGAALGRGRAPDRAAAGASRALPGVGGPDAGRARRRSPSRAGCRWSRCRWPSPPRSRAWMSTPRRRCRWAMATPSRCPRVPRHDAGSESTYGVFGPDGEVVALMAPRDGMLRALVVLAPS